MASSAYLLREARRRAGLSQRALARSTRVSQPRISGYETGRLQPASDTLLRLLAATGHQVQIVSTVDASREAARKLELVCAMAMALPARAPGPLRYPPLRRLSA